MKSNKNNLFVLDAIWFTGQDKDLMLKNMNQDSMQFRKVTQKLIVKKGFGNFIKNRYLLSTEETLNSFFISDKRTFCEYF